VTAPSREIELGSCKHMNFDAEVLVNRIEDTGAFVADIRVKCSDCQLPFRWIGPEMGLDYRKPMVSVDRRELRAPIEPDVAESIARLDGKSRPLGFSILSSRPPETHS
jgi:hypothetical protein